MAAIASLEELKKVNEGLKKLKQEEPEGYKKIADLIKKNRKVGYRNICKMMLGEVTPEELKGM